MTNSAEIYEVTLKQIEAQPLSCPMIDEVIWNQHPQVFLPILKTGAATCPYCSRKFKLIDFDQQFSTSVTDTGSL